MSWNLTIERQRPFGSCQLQANHHQHQQHRNQHWLFALLAQAEQSSSELSYIRRQETATGNQGTPQHLAGGPAINS
jgi:hypothetical protein